MEQAELHVAPPWVMRLNLDGKAKMIGLFLNQEMYAAYDAQRSALYKVWKGDILFTGPVFDNIHGRQPITRGASYITDSTLISPWFLRSGSEVKRVDATYQGYLRKENTVTLKYELSLSNGQVVTIEESPEFKNSADGRPGFERIIKTFGVPKGSEILIEVSFEHLRYESDIETNGERLNLSFDPQTHDWGNSISGTGKIILKADGETYIRSYFEPKATAHIDSEQAGIEETQLDELQKEGSNEVGLDDMEMLAKSGAGIIGQSDCAACHAADKLLIGPSYSMISQKYESTLEQVEQIAEKIIQGGSGIWGERAMSPHPNISVSDARAMTAYILSIAPDTPSERNPGVAVSFYDIGQPLSSLPEVVAGQSPNASELYPNIDFRSGNPDIGRDTDENFNNFDIDFVMEVSTYLNLTESKQYDFQFIANNGGRLTIDGKLVSEGQYYEGTFVDEIELFLEKGAHHIKIDFYHHLFNKYLVLGWRENKRAEYEPIPPSYFTFNAFDIKPTSPGIKRLVQNNAPGFGASLDRVHPSFELSAVRPKGFKPRVGDIEFMSGGRLALCTWDGEVYILDDVTGSSENVGIRKVADGLCEPLGITVIEDEIYVLQRWELTKLVDHDGDQVADEYVRIFDWGAKGNFHEWSFGLLYRDGYFYFSAGIALGQGSHNQPVDRGKAFKVDMEGNYEHIAYGLKEPNGIGFGPDGEIFIADNEGEGNPVNEILHIPLNGNPFYGVREVHADHLQEDIRETPPAILLTQNEIGNSPSQPILMHHGPYAGQMIHGDITHGGIKRDFIEKIQGQYQGAVFRFSQGLEVGINRMEWGPDGALYVSGLGGNQDFGHQGHRFGLQRLTYNGTPAFEMLAIRAKSNGLEVEFTKPLRIGDGTEPSDYKVQQWYFKWGGEEENNQAKRGLENLKIRSVSLFEDRKSVFLEMEGMKEEHVVYVQLQPTFLSEENEQLWSNEGWYTMNRFSDEAGIVSPTPFTSMPNALTRLELEQGWTSLFDGNSTKGWEKLPNSQGWKIGKGHLVGQEASALMATTASFENIELEFDWKVENGAEGGVLYNLLPSVDWKQAITLSPRFQLTDDKGQDAKNVHTHKAGAIYDIKAPEFVVTNSTNTYNKARLVLSGNHVEHWINGIQVLDDEIGTKAWKESLNGSIYEQEPDFGVVSETRIAIYAKKGKIWIRNIRSRKLQKGDL